MSRLVLLLLGPPRIDRDGTPVVMDTRKAVALLAYLAVTGEHPTREGLAALLYPESDTSHARAALRRTLFVLKAAIGEEWLILDRDGVALRRSDAFWCDVAEFQRHLAQCKTHGHAEMEACPICLTHLAEAAALYRDEFLAGFTLPDSAAFDDWLFFQSEGLRRQFATVLERLVAGHTALEEYETAITYARRWLALDPLHEPTHCHLIQLYTWSGQPVAALRQYQECVRLLEAELGVPPEAKTTALYEQIRQGSLTKRANKVKAPASPSLVSPPPPLLSAAQAKQDEIRIVTVLCVGLSDLPETSQEHTPEEAAQRVKHLLQVMEKILIRYAARVDRFLGDGVLAVFGAEQTHEDDPERALRAALDIRQAAQATGLAVSAGIHTGPSYLGHMGSALMPAPSALGRVVNLAVRLQGHAEAGQILVGEATYRQTHAAVRFTRLMLTLRGIDKSVPAYQVERLRSRPQKARGFAHLHAELIGRADELAKLKRALDAVQQGEGQMAVLTGEAGVGKSRLVTELKQIAQREFGLAEYTPHLTFRIPHSTFLWLEGRCLELGMSASYWPLLDMLRAYFAGQPEDTLAATHVAVRIIATLADMVARGDLSTEQMEEIGSLLGHLLLVHYGHDWDERLRHADPEQIRHRMLSGLRTFFIALARRQPLVLVFEDLHWADTLSMNLIALFMETLAHHPILLLCVYRPEQEHGCGRLPTLAARKCPERFTEVHLRELTPAQSRALVKALLTIENLSPTVKNLILAKAQGNPLFVEEVIRALVDADIIYRTGKVWRAREVIERFIVPESVQSLILSRVDRLGAEAKGVLQRAAVVGRLFRRRVLAQMMPSATDLEQVLAELEARDLIYQERVIPELEYSFKHVLMQDAIYGTLLRAQREQYHQQVAEALEQLYADNLVEYYEQLAYHYEHSALDAKAIEYLLKAGEKARRAYLNDEAIDYYRRALAQLRTSSLPDSEGGNANGSPKGIAANEACLTDKQRVAGGEVQTWRLEALTKLGQVCFGVSKVDEAEAHFRQAIALGRETQLTPRALAHVYYWLGEILWWKSRFEEMVSIGEEGLALLGNDTQSLEAALMNTTVALGYRLTRNLEKAQEFDFRNAPFIQTLPYTEELASCYRHICLTYIYHEKNIEEAIKWARVLEHKAEQHHDLRALANLYAGVMGQIQRRCGDLHGAVSYIQRALPLFAKIGDTKQELACLDILGELFQQLGDLNRAEECATRTLEIASVVGHIDQEPYGYRRLGVIALCRGAGTKGVEIFQTYIQACQQTNNRIYAAWGNFCLGQAYLAQGKRLEALSQLEKTLADLMQTPVKQFFRYTTDIFAMLLNTLEEACQDAGLFRTYCQRIRTEDLGPTGSAFMQWFLEPTQPDWELQIEDCRLSTDNLHKLQSATQNGDWTWHDPFNDCAYTLHNGLEIHAANGRTLWNINRSAPRLLRLVSGDFAVQTVCASLSDVQPAIGGLLLWKDEQNYLRLDKGLLGTSEISFRGCLAGQDVVIGRGRLPTARAYLRLERRDLHVRTLCSADGEQWFTVGYVDFPVDDPLQVGLHAIGDIDRLIYPGAYPDGTAIRFESFAVYRGQ